MSNLFKKLSTLQNPRMLQWHPVVGLDPLVVVDNAVQVYDQGDGKRAVLADDGHAKLNAHEGLNIKSIIQTADGFQILTFKYSWVEIINVILQNSNFFNFLPVIKMNNFFGLFS